MRSPQAEAGHAYGRAYLATCLLLLWLAGNGLRLTLLAVPPLIPLIHADLHMSETQVGILAGLPVVLFACASIPGSLLIARFGALATAVAGLLISALGSALRGAAPDVATLYLTTIITGFGIAVMQPAMPPLTRAWLPDRIGFGTAVYANGLLIGEILPISLTLPVVLPLLGGSWRLGLVAWAIPCVIIAAVMVAMAPRNPAGAPPATRPWPQWRNPLLWRLGLVLGGMNAAYFTSNHFLPDYLNAIGRGDLVDPALNALNLGQLPGSALLLWLASRVQRRAATYFVLGVVTLAGALGIMFGNGAVVIAGAGLVGFASASVLILILALPALLSRQEDVPSMAAGIFTISYTCAVIVPVASGLAWDLTGVPAVAFVPICIGALMITGIAPTLGLARRTPAPA
jgi:CP family cyanate transporter-like MFS transporter